MFPHELYFFKNTPKTNIYKQDLNIYACLRDQWTPSVSSPDNNKFNIESEN